MWAAFPTMLIANFTATAVQPLPERDAVDVAEHRTIISALKLRDASAAEQAMRKHILVTAENLVDLSKGAGMTTLMPIGGNESHKKPVVMQEFVRRAGGEHADIVIFPQPSVLQDTGKD